MDLQGSEHNISCWDLGEDDCAGHTECEAHFAIWGKKKKKKSVFTYCDYATATPTTKPPRKR